MAGKNAQGEDRRCWGFVPPVPAPILTQIAQGAEAAGMEGVFAAQVYGPPFVPLAAAAAVTQRIKLATGIAIAAARSPLETATAAMALDHISMGPTVLGPGPRVSAWTTGSTR